MAESLWGARHIIARHVAFDNDPLNPGNVLPAEIWKTGRNLFGGRVFVEKIFTAAELSTNEWAAEAAPLAAFARTGAPECALA